MTPRFSFKPIAQVHSARATCYGLPGIHLGELSFRLLDATKVGDRINVLCEVADRTTGVPLKIEFNVDLTPEQLAMPAEGQLRAAILMVMQHEVNEQIYKDVVRIFEPHLEIPWAWPQEGPTQ